VFTRRHDYSQISNPSTPTEAVAMTTVLLDRWWTTRCRVEELLCSLSPPRRVLHNVHITNLPRLISGDLISSQLKGLWGDPVRRGCDQSQRIWLRWNDEMEPVDVTWGQMSWGEVRFVIWKLLNLARYAAISLSAMQPKTKTLDCCVTSNDKNSVTGDRKFFGRRTVWLAAGFA